MIDECVCIWILSGTDSFTVQLLYCVFGLDTVYSKMWPACWSRAALLANKLRNSGIFLCLFCIDRHSWLRYPHQSDLLKKKSLQREIVYKCMSARPHLWIYLCLTSSWFDRSILNCSWTLCDSLMYILTHDGWSSGTCKQVLSLLPKA